jgi:hypothetical protein
MEHNRKLLSFVLIKSWSAFHSDAQGRTEWHFLRHVCYICVGSRRDGHPHNHSTREHAQFAHRPQRHGAAAGRA